CTQRMIVVCAIDRPRSAIISTRSRRLSLKRRYQRTHRMMTSRSKWRPSNSSATAFSLPIDDLSQLSTSMYLIGRRHSTQTPIVYVALRDIGIDEELTVDYAMNDDDPYEMKCQCGTKSCRGKITGVD